VNALSPINIDTLTKGDYISVVHLQEITGEIEGTDEYAFAIMAFKQELEAELQKRLGKKLTIKCENGGLRILTDPEAAEYNARQIEQSKRRIYRAHDRNMDVDEANLSPQERAVHYRRLELGSKYVQALKKVSRQVGVEPHKRNSPGLP
jgi:hypothetical protein